MFGSNKLINAIAAKAVEKVKKDNEPKLNAAIIFLAVIGFIAIVGAAAYVVYRFLQPEYFEDYDEDLFDEEFEEE